jgi:hypothetical protein
VRRSSATVEGIAATKSPADSREGAVPKSGVADLTLPELVVVMDGGSSTEAPSHAWTTSSSNDSNSRVDTRSGDDNNST